MLSTRFKLIPIIIMAAGLTLAPALSLAAAPTTLGQGFEISPPKYDLPAHPGEVLTTTINLRNTTSIPITAHAILNDFVPKNTTGEPGILADGSDGGATSMKGWFVAMPDQVIPPGILKTFTVRVNVPSNASPGGHYGVVRFTSGTPSTNGNNGVALTASVGTLYLISVTGAVREDLNVSQFYVQQYGKRGTWFQKGDLQFVNEFRNSGNVHVKPVGTLFVTDMFGHKVAQLKVNSAEGNVLPTSTRSFTEDFNKKLFGHYTARIFLRYGNGKQLESSAVKFWVFPWQLILIGLAIIAILVVAAKTLRIEPRRKR